MNRDSDSSQKTTPVAKGRPTWWIFFPGFLLICCCLYLISATDWLVAGNMIGLLGAGLVSLSVWHSVKRRMK